MRPVKTTEERDLLIFEREYREKGCRLIAGCDEAGRGPLAGPVSCGAVILPEGLIIPGVDDSKKLSEKRREYLYDLILEKALAFSVVFIDNETIDEINILNATKRGMEQALLNLKPRPDVALIDAVKGLNLPFPSLPIIKGDTLSHSIAAASILAKVERDRLMKRYGEEYPGYGFAAHMGYPTAYHREAVQRLGPCPIHRKSFLKNIVKQVN